jgi:hypothetical protein
MLIVPPRAVPHICSPGLIETLCCVPSERLPRIEISPLPRGGGSKLSELEGLAVEGFREETQVANLRVTGGFILTRSSSFRP